MYLAGETKRRLCTGQGIDVIAAHIMIPRATAAIAKAATTAKTPMMLSPTVPGQCRRPPHTHTQTMAHLRRFSRQTSDSAGHTIGRTHGLGEQVVGLAHGWGSK